MAFGGGSAAMLGTSRPPASSQTRSQPHVQLPEYRTTHTIPLETSSRFSLTGGAAPIVLYPPQELLVVAPPKPSPVPQPQPHATQPDTHSPGPRQHLKRRPGYKVSLASATWGPQPPGPTNNTSQRPGLRWQSDLSHQQQAAFVDVVRQRLQEGCSVLALGCPSGPERMFGYLGPVMDKVLQGHRASGRGAAGPSVRVLILSASREAAESVRHAASDLGYRQAQHVQVVCGRSPILEDIESLRAACPDVLVATPGKAMQLLTQAPRGCKLDELFHDLEVVVLDGVMQLLGQPSVRSQVESIIQALSRPTDHGRSPIKHHPKYQVPIDIMVLSTTSSQATLEQHRPSSSVQLVMLEQNSQLPHHVAVQAAAATQLLTSQPVTAAHLQHTRSTFLSQHDHHNTHLGSTAAVVSLLWPSLSSSTSHTTTLLPLQGIDDKGSTNTDSVPAPPAPHYQRLVIVTEVDIAVQLAALLQAHADAHPRHRVLVLCPTVALLRVWARVARQLGHKVLELHGRRAQPAATAVLDTFRQPPPVPASARRRRLSVMAGTAAGRRIPMGRMRRAQGVAVDGVLTADNSGDAASAAAPDGPAQPLPLDVSLDSGDGDEPDMGDAVSAPGLVLFSAGGATNDQVFTHMTLMIQVGIPRHTPQVSDFTHHTHQAAAAEHTVHVETILLVSEAEVPGLPALHQVLHPSTPHVAPIVQHDRTPPRTVPAHTTTDTDFVQRPAGQGRTLSTPSAPMQQGSQALGALPLQHPHNGDTSLQDLTSYLLQPHRKWQSSLTAQDIPITLTSPAATSSPADHKHANGHTDGHANGHANGYTDGHANGHADGHANGYTDGHANGHADGHAAVGHVRVSHETGKVTRTWQVQWRRSSPMHAGSLEGKVHACMSNIMSVLREVAWTSWMSHLRLHPVVPAPPAGDCWVHLCHSAAAGLALSSLPSIHEHVASAWGQPYIRGLTVQRPNVQDVQDVPDRPDLLPMLQMMGHTAGTSLQGAASSPRVPTSALTHTPIPMSNPTATHITRLAHIFNEVVQFRTRPSRTAMARRMLRQYQWSCGLHRAGDVPSETMMSLVTARMARRMRRARKGYAQRVRAMRERKRSRNAVIQNEEEEQQPDVEDRDHE